MFCSRTGDQIAPRPSTGTRRLTAVAAALAVAACPEWALGRPPGRDARAAVSVRRAGGPSTGGAKTIFALPRGLIARAAAAAAASAAVWTVFGLMRAAERGPSEAVVGVLRGPAAGAVAAIFASQRPALLRSSRGGGLYGP